MKIGLECQRLFRKKKHGIEIVSIEIINEIYKLKSKHEVVVLAAKDDSNDLLDKSVVISDYGYVRSAYPLWEQFILPRAAKKEKVDILHCLCNTAPLYPRTPLVVTIHDIIYLETLRNFNGSLYQQVGNLYRRWNVPLSMKNASRIITVSHFEKKRIIEMLKVPEEVVTVVYNGISSKFHTVAPNSDKLAATKHKYNLPDKFFMFLGNKAHKKNTTGLLRAFEKYYNSTENPWPLFIADTTPGYIDDVLSEAGVDLSLRNAIITADYIPHGELVYFYCLASCFLYPSLREAFGLPILEAMACSTPVITSTTSAMPEISGDAALLADPYSIDDMADKMIMIGKSTDLQKDLVAKGLENIKKFTWKGAAEQLLTVYEEVYNQKSYSRK